MGLPGSTFYDVPAEKTDDAEIAARITAICEEFECYGYRKVGAELRHQRIVVNAKKIHRIIREHDLQPKRRRRFVATTKGCISLGPLLIGRHSDRGLGLAEELPPERRE